MVEKLSILLSKSSNQERSSQKTERLLEKDDIFHLLQNQRRRRVLEYLANQTQECTLRDLAEQIAAWENDIPIEQISSEERQRVYIALYQAHLPKLDEFGVIEYNQSRGTVRRTERADELDQYRLISSPAPPSSSESASRFDSPVSAENHKSGAERSSQNTGQTTTGKEVRGNHDSSTTSNESTELSERLKGKASAQEVQGIAVGIGIVVGFAGGRWGIRSRKFYVCVTGLALLAHAYRV